MDRRFFIFFAFIVVDNIVAQQLGTQVNSGTDASYRSSGSVTPNVVNGEPRSTPQLRIDVANPPLFAPIAGQNTFRPGPNPSGVYPGQNTFGPGPSPLGAYPGYNTFGSGQTPFGVNSGQNTFGLEQTPFGAHAQLKTVGTGQPDYGNINDPNSKGYTYTWSGPNFEKTVYGTKNSAGFEWKFHFP